MPKPSMRTLHLRFLHRSLPRYFRFQNFTFHRQIPNCEPWLVGFPPHVVSLLQADPSNTAMDVGRGRSLFNVPTTHFLLDPHFRFPVLKNISKSKAHSKSIYNMHLVCPDLNLAQATATETSSQHYVHEDQSHDPSIYIEDNDMQEPQLIQTHRQPQYNLQV